MPSTKPQKIEITLGDLARAYQVAPRTILKWMREGLPEHKFQEIQDQYDGRSEFEIVALRAVKP